MKSIAVNKEELGIDPANRSGRLKTAFGGLKLYLPFGIIKSNLYFKVKINNNLIYDIC